MAGYQLDKRLLTIAGMVREGSVVADVGTDHGYLICHLVLERKCPRGFACDIAAGPLARARAHICREGLDARILTVQCDGLSGVPCDGVNDVVVAGMGGDLIARIVIGWEGSRDAEKLFILQPMSKPEHLRRALYKNGFVLMDEVPVQCGGFCYTVMAVRYTGHCMEVSRHFCHTGKYWEKENWEEDHIAYMRGIHLLMEKKAAGYAASREHAAKAQEYREIALQLKGRLERC